MQAGQLAALIIARAQEVRAEEIALAALVVLIYAVLCTLLPSAGSIPYADTWMCRTATSASLATTYTWAGQDLLGQSVNDDVNPPVVTSYVHRAVSSLGEYNPQSGVLAYAYDPRGNVSGLVGFVAQTPIFGSTRAGVGWADWSVLGNMPGGHHGEAWGSGVGDAGAAVAGVRR